MNAPTKEQAYQFAAMLASGAPGREAIRYFLPDDDEGSPALQENMLDKWMRDRGVAAAIRSFQGKDWQEMTTDERMRCSLDKTYTEMAYFLYSRNYVELTGNEKLKADTCRQALETKLAGMAGKMDAMSRFWDDVVKGNIKLADPAAVTKPAKLPAPDPPTLLAE